MPYHSIGLNRTEDIVNSACERCSIIENSKVANQFDSAVFNNYTHQEPPLQSSICTDYSGYSCVGDYFSEKPDKIAPPYIFYIIGSLMMIVFVLGFSENAIVLYVYVRNRKLRTVSNAFIVGLSLSDIGQAIFNLPLVVIANFSKGWIFGYGGCMYYGFVTTTFGLAQISLLTVIALERYCIIVHHTRVFSSSMTKACLAIAACFLYASGWALGPLFGWSEYKIEKFGTRCAVSWEIKDMTYLSYTLCLFTFVWFIPLFLITFGYTSIACMIYRERSMKRTIRSTNDSKTTKEQKVAITVLIMIGAFVISWLPYSAVALYTAINGTKNLSFAATLIPALIAKSSIIWNPIIYVVRHRDFRKACIGTLKLCVFCNPAQNGESSVKTDYTQRRQLQENIETTQRLMRKSSVSCSEISSSHGSCAGTKVSGLLFESFDTVGKGDKLPKLTSKDSWKNSPHPVVRKSFERKGTIVSCQDSEVFPSARPKETITKTCLRKNFLRTASASKVLSTMADIECEAGPSNVHHMETPYSGAEENAHDHIKFSVHSQMSPKINAHTRSLKLRRQVSVDSTQYGRPIKLLRDFKPLNYKHGGISTAMFEERCDAIALPYRRKPRAHLSGRRHLSDSSTTVNKDRYSKYDAKQKRLMMKQKTLKQTIEMSVFERDTNVFNFDDIQDEPEGLPFHTNDDDNQDTFIGACAMIRQSTV